MDRASRIGVLGCEVEEYLDVIGRNGLNQTTPGIVQEPLEAVKLPKSGFEE